MSTSITTEELDDLTVVAPRLATLLKYIDDCVARNVRPDCRTLQVHSCRIVADNLPALIQAARELAALKAIAADGLKNMDNPDYTGPVVAELANALRSIRGSATSEATPPTSNPDDFDLRTWNPGNHNPPDGVL